MSAAGNPQLNRPNTLTQHDVRLNREVTATRWKRRTRHGSAPIPSLRRISAATTSAAGRSASSTFVAALASSKATAADAVGGGDLDVRQGARGELAGDRCGNRSNRIATPAMTSASAARETRRGGRVCRECSCAFEDRAASSKSRNRPRWGLGLSWQSLAERGFSPRRPPRTSGNSSQNGVGSCRTAIDLSRRRG